MPDRYFGFIQAASEKFHRPVQLLTPGMIRNPFLKKSIEREVASVLRLHIGTVRTHYSRAKGRLRDELRIIKRKDSHALLDERPPIKPAFLPAASAGWERGANI